MNQNKKTGWKIRRLYHEFNRVYDDLLLFDPEEEGLDIDEGYIKRDLLEGELRTIADEIKKLKPSDYMFANYELSYILTYAY